MSSQKREKISYGMRCSWKKRKCCWAATWWEVVFTSLMSMMSMSLLPKRYHFVSHGNDRHDLSTTVYLLPIKMSRTETTNVIQAFIAYTMYIHQGRDFKQVHYDHTGWAWLEMYYVLTSLLPHLACVVQYVLNAIKLTVIVNQLQTDTSSFIQVLYVMKNKGPNIKFDAENKSQDCY